jgi:hypothetical protein
MEEFEVKKKYQWTSGPRANQLEVYLAEDDSLIWFESGRNVQKEMMDVQLRQIEDSMYNSLVNAQSERERIQGLLGNDAPLTMSNITPEQLGLNQSAATPEPIPVIEPVKEENPIALILEKQKKLEVVDIKMNMPVEIPSAKVYEFLTMMFDEDEVLDILSAKITEKFSIEDIQIIVKNSIIKYYTEENNSKPE